MVERLAMTDGGHMVPWSDGDYVLYSTFAALKAENERLAEELAGASSREEVLKAEIEEQRERLIQFANAFDAGYAAAERSLAERAGGVKVEGWLTKAVNHLLPNWNSYSDRPIRLSTVKGIPDEHHCVPRLGVKQWDSDNGDLTLSMMVGNDHSKGGVWIEHRFSPEQCIQIVASILSKPSIEPHVGPLLSVLATEPAAPEGQQPVALPPYGKMPFDELGRDVSEACIGVRCDFDFGETYPGHVMTGINFNSLNRIVSKYVTRPAEQAVTDLARVAQSIHDKLASESASVTIFDQNELRDALAALAQKEVKP